MSRNGAGTYSLYPGVNPVVTGTIITSTWANNTLNDLATAMTASVANDGQTPILANLPMATFRHTLVGNGVARTDYAAVGQVQDNSIAWGGTAGGTADVLTLTLSPVLTAYVTGQRFLFISSASPNATTTPTLNINGVGAKIFLRKDGTTIVAGDIPASTLIEAVYNGTNMLLNANPSAGTTGITTLGTVTTGTWNATVITGQYGGTGVANTGKTITLGGNFVTSGAFAATLTLTNTTNVTLPTTGTLSTLAGAEALTNKTVNKVTITAPTSSATLTLIDGSTLATAGAFSTTLTATGATNVTLPTTGTLATLAGSEVLTNKTITAPVIATIVSGAGTNTLPTATGTLLSTAAAVTVAQGGTGLATLTANNVILGNGASNVAFVAPGTSGNVLTSNGTTWTSSAGASSGVVYLSQVVASGASTADLETTFDATYDEYIIIGTGITASTTLNLLGRMKISGAYDTGANYSYTVDISSSSAYAGAAATTGTSFQIVSDLRNTAGSTCNVIIHVHNPSSTSLTKAIDWIGSRHRASGDALKGSGCGSNFGTAAMTGFRFLPSTGTFSGTFRLYGVKNS